MSVVAVDQVPCLGGSVFCWLKAMNAIPVIRIAEHVDRSFMDMGEGRFHYAQTQSYRKLFRSGGTSLAIGNTLRKIFIRVFFVIFASRRSKTALFQQRL